MIQLNLPEISQLDRVYARADKPKFHNGTGRYGYKNSSLPKTAGIYFIFNTSDELILIISLTLCCMFVMEMKKMKW